MSNNDATIMEPCNDWYSHFWWAGCCVLVQRPCQMCAVWHMITYLLTKCNDSHQWSLHYITHRIARNMAQAYEALEDENTGA